MLRKAMRNIMSNLLLVMSRQDTRCILWVETECIFDPTGQTIIEKNPNKSSEDSREKCYS